jgi:hypothetical protein
VIYLNDKFVKIPDTVNTVGIKTSSDIIETPGVWPLIDEKFRFLNIIAVGNKNGIDHTISLNLLKKRFPKAKFIFDCRNGPYLVSHYKEILEHFDGHMTLDYDVANPKSLFMFHGMMIRCMPFEGFFWEPSKEKKWDFSILTRVGDNKSKRWDRCVKIVDKLCSNGLTGLVITQRGDFSRVLKTRSSKERILGEYVKTGLLSLSGWIEHHKFHKLQSMAHVSIFPNTLDAFPKNIIENILADKLVIISNDLLYGKSVIVPEFGECLDFASDSVLDRCLEIIEKEKRRKTPLNNRKRWLKKYGFIPLTKSWAEELNKKFKTDCKLAFFMNHIERVKQNNQISL